MSLKRKRITSVLRTIYINIIPITPYDKWLANKLKGVHYSRRYSATSQLKKDYIKLVRQRNIKE